MLLETTILNKDKFFGSNVYATNKLISSKSEILKVQQYSLGSLGKLKGILLKTFTQIDLNIGSQPKN
jgi:hypothetical protein